MSIIRDEKNFNLDNLTIESPNGMQGGSYHCRFKYNGDDMLFQTSKNCCKKFKNDKNYVDIILDNGLC